MRFLDDERRSIPRAADDEQRAWELPVSLRAAAGDAPTTIDGYGVRFNEETIISGLFRELFVPGSLDESFRNDDILVTFNHDANCLLGRKSNGTASFRTDAAGGLYSVALNANDAMAMNVAAKVQRRDVTGSSLVFRADLDGDDEWVRDDPAKLPLRKIKRATVVEMGPVVLPCYAATTATARSRAEQLQGGASSSRADADRVRHLQLARVSCPLPAMTDAARCQRLQVARSTGRPMFASDAHRARAIARMLATTGAREHAFKTGVSDRVVYGR
jgi:HK97 family phage prohead protease